jgi:cytochrome c oxidase subunit II
LVDTRAEYHDLQAIYLPIAVGVFAAVALLVLFAVVRFRRREGREPSRRSEAPVLEAVYALVLAGVVGFLVALTFRTESKVDAVAKRPGLEVDVIVAKWRWRFDYPRLGLSQVGTDKLPPLLVVPTGTTVRFDMTSQDVIHAFWIPDLRFKRDAFPRRTTRFDLVFDRKGFYSNGRCAQYCGLRHGDMRFTVQAVSPSEFGAWARGRAKTGAAP